MLTLNFLHNLQRGAHNGLNLDEWGKFLVVQALNTVLPMGVAKFLAGPIAYVILLHVKRTVIKYELEGQMGELRKLTRERLKDPEKMRQAFTNLATVKVDDN